MDDSTGDARLTVLRIYGALRLVRIVLRVRLSGGARNCADRRLSDPKRGQIGLAAPTVNRARHARCCFGNAARPEGEGLIFGRPDNFLTLRRRGLSEALLKGGRQQRSQTSPAALQLAEIG